MASITAAVYTRESKGNPDSVARQHEDALQFVERRGWTLGPVLGDDDQSAAGKRPRPDFDRLIRLVTDGQIQVIVAWTWERLERNRREGLRLIEACQEHSIMIALVRGMDIDMSTPTGRMMADHLASQARFEIEMKADRMDRALRQRAEKGEPPKRRAFGYTDDGAIHPVEGPIVAEAFERLLGGGSIVGITRWLNEQDLHTTGCLCPRCAPDRERPEGMSDEAWARQRRERGWTGPAVRLMFRRARYAGIRTYRGEEVGRGTWPALVGEEVYRAAVSLLDAPSRRNHHGPYARKHLGAALYLCGRCAADGITTTMRTWYRTYKNADGQRKVRMYRCRVSGHLARIAAPIDEHVEQMIAARLRRPDLADLLAEEAPDLSPLRTEATALRQRLDTLADDIELPEAVLKRRVRALENRLDEVQAQLAEAGRVSALASVAGAPDPAAAWLNLDDIAARQAVIRELATVTLMPAPVGGKTFDPATVSIEPRSVS